MWSAARLLEKDSDFKYATVVHCDTPSGVLNDISKICPLLAEYGILNVVDSVAGMFGEAVDFDASCIDILCGGSQKALSAPPGSDDGMGQRKAKQVMQTAKRRWPRFTRTCSISCRTMRTSVSHIPCRSAIS